MTIKKKTTACRFCDRTDTVLRSGFCIPRCEDPQVVEAKAPKLANGTDAPDPDQWSMFLRLLAERGPYSEISGQKLITDTKHKFFVNQFSHTLGKGNYPDYKLDERNLVLMTAKEHELWTDHKESLRGLASWQQVFEMEAILIREATAKYAQKRFV